MDLLRSTIYFVICNAWIFLASMYVYQFIENDNGDDVMELRSCTRVQISIWIVMWSRSKQHVLIFQFDVYFSNVCEILILKLFRRIINLRLFLWVQDKKLTFEKKCSGLGNEKICVFGIEMQFISFFICLVPHLFHQDLIRSILNQSSL